MLLVKATSRACGAVAAHARVWVRSWHRENQAVCSSPVLIALGWGGKSSGPAMAFVGVLDPPRLHETSFLKTKKKQGKQANKQKCSKLSDASTRFYFSFPFHKVLLFKKIRMGIFTCKYVCVLC